MLNTLHAVLEQFIQLSCSISITFNLKSKLLIKYLHLCQGFSLPSLLYFKPHQSHDCCFLVHFHLTMPKLTYCLIVHFKKNPCKDTNNLVFKPHQGNLNNDQEHFFLLVCAHIVKCFAVSLTHGMWSRA